MKNNILYLIFLVILTINEISYSQNIYSNNEITLSIDNSYAKNMNWDKLFFDKNEIRSGNPVGIMKSIAVDDERNLFIGNYSSYNIHKLNAKGELIKTFGGKGNDTGEFNFRPTLQGILDNKFLLLSDNRGHIYLFTLDGNLIRTIDLEYIPRRIIPLKNNKIAIAGYVPMGNGNAKKIITIKDIQTKKEIIIDSYMNRLDNIEPVKIKHNNRIISLSVPKWIEYDILIERTIDGNLIVGRNNSNEINIYSTQGLLMQTFHINIKPLKLEQKRIEEHKDKLRTYFKKYGALDKAEQAIESMQFPEFYPFYYHVSTDGYGNILFFYYSNESSEYYFSVYDRNGSYINDCKLDNSKYNLNINNRFQSIEFVKNNLYAYIQVKNSESKKIKIIKVILK